MHEGNALIFQIIATFCVFEGCLSGFTLAEAKFVRFYFRRSCFCYIMIEA